MPIDLAKLSARAIPPRPINPLEIWNQLDRAVGKEYLRPIQEGVLKQWFDQRNYPDTIIKMNTGTGKTLVGLLILQSSLNESQGPALYLCPDKYLVTQVIDQAKQFGVRCVSFEEQKWGIPSEFLNGEAILVANAKKLFNGRSVFGVLGGPGAPVPIGTVVLDDAHTCIEQVRSQFTISIKHDHPAFQKLLALFAQSLNQQRPGTFAEVRAGDYAAFMAVPYWTWCDSQAEIVHILSEYRENEELKFVWPFLKDALSICDCVVSGSFLQIVARVAQPQFVPSFESAKRRVFLSATLLDDSQMSRDLGVSAESIQRQIKPNEFDDLGERLTVIPSDVEPALDTAFVIRLLEKNTKMNRVVLVPTTKDSERWVAAGAKPVLASNIDEELQPLRSSKGAFLALISRYDGVDLPDDACRLLVLDSLPRAASLYDRYLQAVLLSSPLVNAKIAQRIEQGLGRATRGKSDYCVVIITGNDLVGFVRNKQNRVHLSPGTNAQLELGMTITSEIKKADKEEDYSNALIQEINRCLRRDEEWKAFYRSQIETSRDAARPYREDEGALELAATEHAACALFLKKDPDQAAAKIQKLIDQPKLTDREKGWFLQLAAAYLYWKDRSKALSMQKKAYELNSFLFVPPEGVRYHRMAEQAESQSALALHKALAYQNSNEYVIEANAICDRLAFGIETELFEQALEDVAWIIGISSSRPEKTIGRGPDCLWMGDNGEFFVMEAKSGVELTRNEIYKSETEQLLHSREWFKQEYQGRKDRVFMFHPAAELANEAVFPKDGRVVTPEILGKFVTSTRRFVSAIAGRSRSELSQQEVHGQLQANGLLFAECFSGAKKLL